MCQVGSRGASEGVGSKEEGQEQGDAMGSLNPGNTTTA